MHRKRTAVSHIIKRFNKEKRVKGSAHKDGLGEKRFIMQICSNRATREKAYRLAYSVYKDRGFVSENLSGMVVCPYDATPFAVTFLAIDRETGEGAGTISIVRDGQGLPCDNIYPEELAGLRFQNRALVEVTRLAIAPKFRNSRELLIQLNNYISLYSRQVWHAADLVIEVNPRHAGFYKRLYLFEQIGTIKECARVKNAPALLLRLDLGLRDTAIQETAGKKKNDVDRKYSRTLYPGFMKFSQEKNVAAELERGYTPMSYPEAVYFGIGEHWCGLTGMEVSATG